MLRNRMMLPPPAHATPLRGMQRSVPFAPPESVSPLDIRTLEQDLETIEALAMAINMFDGGVVLVSHDERLISLIADEIWSVNRGVDGRPGSVTVFDGSFEARTKRTRGHADAPPSSLRCGCCLL